ncbi:hypothetical protein [Nonomuraea sp. NPDC049309]
MRVREVMTGPAVAVRRAASHAHAGKIAGVLARTVPGIARVEHIRRSP